jgi:hypothetical protein
MPVFDCFLAPSECLLIVVSRLAVLRKIVAGGSRAVALNVAYVALGRAFHVADEFTVTLVAAVDARANQVASFDQSLSYERRSLLGAEDVDVGTGFLEHAA